MPNASTKIILSLALLGCCWALKSQAQNPAVPAPSVRLDQKGLNQVHPAKQQALSRQSSWQTFQKAHPSWASWFNENTGLPHKAYGKPIKVQGENTKALVNEALENILAPFPVKTKQLRLANTWESADHRFALLKQEYKGKPVMTSGVKLRFTKNGALTQFSLDYYPEIGKLPKAKITGDALKKAAKADVTGKVAETTLTDGYKILPNNGEFHLVQVVRVRGQHPRQNMPFDYRTVVDVANGDVLYRKNRVVEAGFEDIPVRARIIDEYPGNGDTSLNLRYLNVEANGNTFYTDSNGQLSLNVPDSTRATFTLEGKFARVQDQGEQPPSFQKILDTSNLQQVSFNNEAALDQRSGYHHTNTIHDYMKSLMPNFTALDNPIDVNTGIEGRGCNAFYNPRDNSMNYFEDNNNCPSFAKVADVVYHEYGHAISTVFYSSNGTTFRNGALGEAFSDIWAMGPTDDPIVGKGSINSPQRDYIRRYDRNPKVYPEDLTGEVHADGEILAGAFWDLRKNLGSLDQMMQLFKATYQALPNAMEGNEGQLYRDVLLEVLTANDNDNNLSNGTPDDDAISSAFARHGITLLAGIDLDHEPKRFRQPNQTARFEASINGQLLSPVGGVRLKYRLNGQQQWQTKDLQQQGGNLTYNGSITGADTGDVMAYYFQLLNQQGQVASTFPEDATEDLSQDLPFYTMYGFEVVSHDSLNSSKGWTINGDAQSGMWTIETPVASFSDVSSQTEEDLVQPGSDHTGGPVNKCAVTENAPSENLQQGFADIDNGETILISPYYNVDTLEAPVIGYHRWFSNATGTNPNNDPFEVYIQSRQGGNWQRVGFTLQQDREWRMRLIDIHERLGDQVEAVRLRFIASDRVDNSEPRSGQSITEGAVDDIVVYEKIRPGFRPTGTGDLTANNSSVEVYPNPTSGQVQVELPKAKDLSRASLLNAQGQVVDQFRLEAGTNTINLQGNVSAKGLYILRWQQNGQVQHQRILYR